MGADQAAANDPDYAYRLAIGKRLSKLRKAKGWSLRDASERSGLSHSFISMVEKGTSEIAVSRLLRLAEAYSIFIADVLSDVEASRAEFVPANQGLMVPSESKDVELAFLATGAWSIQPFRMTFEAGAVVADLNHHGDEFIHCVSGCIIVTVDGTEFRLSEGDTLTIPEFSDHAYENRSQARARLLGGVSRGEGDKTSRTYLPQTRADS